MFSFLNVVKIMNYFGRSCDPLFTLATPLRKREKGSFTTKELTMNPSAGNKMSTRMPPLVVHQEPQKKQGNDEETKFKQEDSPQPGWFGKGLGKRKSLRKRRSSKS